MGRVGAVLAIGVCLLVLGVRDGLAEATRVNAFGQHAEDHVRVARDVLAALKGVETAPHDRKAEARALLDQAMEVVRLPERLTFSVEPSERICRLCNTFIGAIVEAIRVENRTGDALSSLVTELCITANIMSPAICQGILYGNMPFLEYIARNTARLDGSYACGVFMRDCSDGTPALEWTVARDLGTKPRAKIRNAMIDVNPAAPAKPYQILQMTDFHWDTDYDTDGTANCGEPVCCRKGQGKPATPEERCGFWGDYRNCDIPWHTMDIFINHVQKNLLKGVDMVYFTGDVIDHGVWVTSREKNEKTIRDTFAVMKQAFGDKPLLPIVGNHEPHPVNVYAPDYITDEAMSSRWIYEILADVWINKTSWLPEDTRPTILRGGFYSVLVQPGFRVIALNTMYCYRLNWWLLYDSADPSDQLAWLVDTLLMAEEANEKVHILSHIPPGSDDCLDVWSREFAKIVDRFSATITAHFNGHTHFDDLVIFYDKSGRPNNVAFNGGSLTSFTDVNPNYKVYQIDGHYEQATWNVIDTEVWALNLTQANQHPDETPEWYQMYSFKKTFDVQSMHPVHLDLFINRLASDDQLIQEYYWYHMLDSDVSHKTGCDKICAQRLICNSVTTVPNDHSQCKKLLNKAHFEIS